MPRRPGRLRRSSPNPCPTLCPGATTICLRCWSVSGRLDTAALAVARPRTGWLRDTLNYYGPWFIAIGVWLTLWEFATAKTGWLPKPFFSPPTGLLHVYVTEWQRLLICIGYSLRLWALGFGVGAAFGYVGGVALGWSKHFAYWGMPILKLIGPVPVTA